MALGFVGIDPNTGGGGSPTVWVEDEAEEIIVQSWTADDALCEEDRRDHVGSGPHARDSGS